MMALERPFAKGSPRGRSSIRTWRSGSTFSRPGANGSSWKVFPAWSRLYHSIHYLDFICSILGEPKDVVCRTYRNPRLSKGYADAGHSALLNYGPVLRCSLYTNHAFDRGPRHSMVQMKVEGTKGVAVAHMQQKLNSPQEAKGHDRLEICLKDNQWKTVKLKEDWFPDAFQGTMANLQRYVSGEDKVLHTRVDDAAKTMALVEACYISSKAKGTAIPKSI